MGCIFQLCFLVTQFSEEKELQKLSEAQNRVTNDIKKLNEKLEALDEEMKRLDEEIKNPTITSTPTPFETMSNQPISLFSSLGSPDAPSVTDPSFFE